ncbi:PIG-L deacetylase family protein [Paraburkholderia unamae]|uniref:GlcNAc-PI de-N-acetylase n=1 Tax=Paraburkholderia unamae TaxID=219649 RepID=A0ABX5K780_9BURK|nr:PIG-L family deacetylase [Paraburkholderia unamae]PVX61397.1 GlcNAc-PI de-N-acetylase [Paraburkholderia unamae]RAR49325.1 GlcNAc-PI de-N-acetylase [Paraburkholderia unamae]
MSFDRQRGAMAGASSALFVVSPHLDDAVFGCAALLAGYPGACVCTVFAGAPDHPQHTEWDRAAGFGNSTQALDERCREDNRALEHCGARALRLPFLDGQYGRLPDVATLAEEVKKHCESMRAGDEAFVAPLGVRHPDHMCVGKAWELLLCTGGLESCIAYEEAIHRTTRGVVAKRLAELEAAGLHVTPLDETWRPARLAARALTAKRLAILEYASQLRAFDARFPADLAKPERYWRVTRA